MVNIYTISDKTLMGKQINTLSAHIAESFFKNNIKVNLQATYSMQDDFEWFETSDDNIYVFLVDKASINLNTKIASLSKTEIIDNHYLKEQVTKYYRNLNLPLEKEAENEWKIPSNARAIINPNGVTQGYIVSIKSQIVIVLPNNFMQTTEIFDDVVIDFVKSQQKKKFKNYTFKTFGLTETSISSILKDEIKNKQKVTINLFTKFMQVDVIVKAQEDNPDLDNIAQKVLLKLDKYIYCVEDIPIEKMVYKLLSLNGLKVAFCEDATMGKLASRLLVQENEVGEVLETSFILPTKKSKIDFLNISEADFAENELNPNVAYDLVASLLSKTSADIAVSTIGHSEKENGVCYIAVGDRKEVHVYKNIFSNSVEEFSDAATVASYFYLIKKLKKNDFHFSQTIV